MNRIQLSKELPLFSFVNTQSLPLWLTISLGISLGSWGCMGNSSNELQDSSAGTNSRMIWVPPLMNPPSTAGTPVAGADVTSGGAAQAGSWGEAGSAGGMGGVDSAGFGSAGFDSAGFDGGTEINEAGTLMGEAGEMMDSTGGSNSMNPMAGFNGGGMVEEPDTGVIELEAGEPVGGSPQGPDPEEFADYALEMLALVNQFRAQGGQCGSQSFPSSGPLSLHPALNRASDLHAQDMADQNYFDHQSLDGRSPWDRIQAEGYQGRNYGENIAAGNASAQATFDQWRNSPGHCSNMLNGSFTELGVGYANNPNSNFRHYWVQKFARPR